MVYSKIYGFLPPSKVIDVDDGVAAVGYKSLSTPPLLILNRRTPLVKTIKLSIRLLNIKNFPYLYTQVRAN